jgi:hypothetical protein
MEVYLLPSNLSALRLLCLFAALWGTSVQAADCDGASRSLVRLSADRVDGVFRSVAASVRALGEEYLQLSRHESEVTDKEETDWKSRSTTDGSTTGFRTWPEGLSPPAFQSAYPGLYSYHDASGSKERIAALVKLERLLPVFRAAFRSFDFSWVYLTTADGTMMIYPYLPMDQAVKNDPPTEQVFYRAADFKRRAVGWTLPYLDLVGAGLMITASYPIYAEDKLLGVASRDITLKQLSRSVLAHLTQGGGRSAFIVDERGLAIDASDPDLAAELEAVNTEKKTAALFYRTATDLAEKAGPDAVASRFDWVNQVTERIIARAAQPNASNVIAVENEGRQVLAARIDSTGWFVVLVTR